MFTGKKTREIFLWRLYWIVSGCALDECELSLVGFLILFEARLFMECVISCVERASFNIWTHKLMHGTQKRTQSERKRKADTNGWMWSKSHALKWIYTHLNNLLAWHTWIGQTDSDMFSFYVWTPAKKRQTRHNCCRLFVCLTLQSGTTLTFVPVRSGRPLKIYQHVYQCWLR